MEIHRIMRETTFYTSGFLLLPRPIRERYKVHILLNFKGNQIMVNYSLAYMNSQPGNPDGKKKYYAKAQASGTVTMDEMAEEIAYATSLTDGDVLNVTRALIRQLNKNLAAGKIVKMENFGSFQLQLQSEGTETEKEFTSANILGARIQFRPGNTIKAATRTGDGGLAFKRVPTLKEAALTGDENGNDGGGTSQPGGGSDNEDPLG